MVVSVDAVKSLVELDAEVKKSGNSMAIYLLVEAHGSDPNMTVEIKHHALCLLLSSAK